MLSVYCDGIAEIHVGGRCRLDNRSARGLGTSCRSGARGVALHLYGRSAALVLHQVLLLLDRRFSNSETTKDL